MSKKVAKFDDKNVNEIRSTVPLEASEKKYSISSASSFTNSASVDSIANSDDRSRNDVGTVSERRVLFKIDMAIMPITVRIIFYKLVLLPNYSLYVTRSSYSMYNFYYILVL